MAGIYKKIAALAAMFSFGCAGDLGQIKGSEVPSGSGREPEKGLEGLVRANYRTNISHQDQAGINRILNAIERVPDHLQQIANDYGGTVVIFDGLLTDNESMREFKGKQIPKWGAGSTYDFLPGVYSVTYKEALIKLNAPFGSHGSISLELHEYGHMIDHALGNAFGLEEISAHPYFAKVHEISRTYRKPDGSSRMSGYSYSYRDEFFAESFANFYFSAETKNKLKAEFPETYGFLSFLEDSAVKGSSAGSFANLKKLDDGSSKPDSVKYQKGNAPQGRCIIY